MEYLTHLYKDNVKLYVSYYIFLVATVLVAYNIEFTQIVTYGWVACGIAVRCLVPRCDGVGFDGSVPGLSATAGRCTRRESGRAVS